MARLKLNKLITIKDLIPINKDLETIIICALRYSLPRSTYMPCEVCDFIEAIWKQLSPNAKETIHRDIQEFYGDSFGDKEPWCRIISLKMDDKKD